MRSLLLTLTLATSLFVACGSAFAASDTTLETVIVRSGNMSVGCTQPSAVPGCAALDAQIRANFSPQEIQALSAREWLPRNP